jgi:hypothetical protein
MEGSSATHAALIAQGRDMLRGLSDDLARLAGAEPDVLCSRALDAIDTVAHEFARFIAELQTASEEELAPLRKEYLKLMVAFASRVRDSVPDQAKRHAIVQRLQCKILEQERELRSVLTPNAAGTSVGPDRL